MGSNFRDIVLPLKRLGLCFLVTCAWVVA